MNITRHTATSMYANLAWQAWEVEIDTRESDLREVWDAQSSDTDLNPEGTMEGNNTAASERFEQLEYSEHLNKPESCFAEWACTNETWSPAFLARLTAADTAQTLPVGGAEPGCRWHEKCRCISLDNLPFAVCALSPRALPQAANMKIPAYGGAPPNVDVWFLTTYMPELEGIN